MALAVLEYPEYKGRSDRRYVYAHVCVHIYIYMYIYIYIRIHLPTYIFFCMAASVPQEGPGFWICQAANIVEALEIGCTTLLVTRLLCMNGVPPPHPSISLNPKPETRTPHNTAGGGGNHGGRGRDRARCDHIRRTGGGGGV